LDVELGNDLVDPHSGHQAHEPVPRAGEQIARVARRVRQFDGTGREGRTLDLSRARVGHRKRALIDPAADRVVADPEQPRRLSDLVAGHDLTISASTDEYRCRFPYLTSVPRHSFLYLCTHPVAISCLHAKLEVYP